MGRGGELRGVKKPYKINFDVEKDIFHNLSITSILADFSSSNFREKKKLAGLFERGYFSLEVIQQSL